LTNTVM